MNAPTCLAMVLLSLYLPAPAFADHSININIADKQALMTLNGIGEVKAEAIIEYRARSGPFAAKEAIQNVSGIGTVTYNNIKDHITVQGGSSTTGSSLPTPNPTPSPTPTPQSTGVPTSYVPPPEQMIFASAGEDLVVIVGADIEFTGRAYNKKKEPLAGLIRYSWNFGDGGSAEGQVVLHRFAYPGRYAVTLQIAQETESASDTLVAEAKPAQLRLTTLTDGALAIENISDRDLDLSRWILSAGGKTFTLSKGTTILTGATVTFSPTNTGITQLTGEIALLYPNGVVAFRAGEGTPDNPPVPTPSPAPAISVMPAVDVVDPPSPREQGTIVSTDTEELSDSADETLTDVSTSSQTAAAADAATGSWKWWTGALLLAAAGAGSVYFARRYAKREWNIIEE